MFFNTIFEIIEPFSVNHIMNYRTVPVAFDQAGLSQYRKMLRYRRLAYFELFRNGVNTQLPVFYELKYLQSRTYRQGLVNLNYFFFVHNISIS